MKLTRFCYSPHGTFGVLEIDGKEFYTVEPPWKDNAVGESCIPEGKYGIRRDHTGRFQVARLENVPNRTFIEIHAGRTMRNSDGCIILGKILSFHNGLWAVGNSSAAISELKRILGPDYSGEITVTSVFAARKASKKKASGKKKSSKG